MLQKLPDIYLFGNRELPEGKKLFINGKIIVL